MYRLCIFDLDGTLLNTLTALNYATNQTLAHFHLGQVTVEDTKRMVGDGYKVQMERALRHFGEENMKYYQEALEEYMKNFSANCMMGVKPYDGIPHLLSRIKELGIRAAVFSNKPHAQAVENIETVFGKGVFDCIRGEMAGVAKKPSPEGAFLICEELQVRPKECLYLGDTNTDMETGIAAGMDTVGVTWGFRGRQELAAFHPKYLAAHPAEVEAILEQARQGQAGWRQAKQEPGGWPGFEWGSERSDADGGFRKDRQENR